MNISKGIKKHYVIISLVLVILISMIAVLYFNRESITSTVRGLKQESTLNDLQDIREEKPISIDNDTSSESKEVKESEQDKTVTTKPTNQVTKPIIPAKPTESTTNKPATDTTQPEVVNPPEEEEEVINLPPTNTLKPGWTRVKRGDVIGYQGISGWTDLSMLAFILKNANNVAISPLINGYFTKTTDALLDSGKYYRPISNGKIFSVQSGQVYQLYSITDGDQSGNLIQKDTVNCTGATKPSKSITSKGYGAPVFAVTDGNLSKPYYDSCGAKFVTLEHDDGLKSMYGHLK